MADDFTQPFPFWVDSPSDFTHSIKVPQVCRMQGSTRHHFTPVRNAKQTVTRGRGKLTHARKTYRKDLLKLGVDVAIICWHQLDSIINSARLRHSKETVRDIGLRGPSVRFPVIAIPAMRPSATTSAGGPHSTMYRECVLA